MKLPQVVVEHLQSDFLAETRPFCVLIDANHRVVDTWGDGEWLGLAGLPAGTDLFEYAPYLLGTLDEGPFRLNFVSSPAGAVMNLVTIPHKDQHYAVFLDARRAHDDLQKKQQVSNEAVLLQANQLKLIARQRDLIAELVEAKVELNHHRRDMERTSAGKTRFIAMMSHEFRTPLASIVNYSDLALEKDSGLEEMRKSIEAISRSSRHLTSLVDAILDEARLDAGHVTLRERDFDLLELLDDLSAMMAPLAAEKGLSYATRVDADVPTHIRADDVCLRQILINLLGNAVKFTEEGGIRLYISCSDGRLVASVADTGPGISLEDQERVFRAFERGGNLQSIRSGAGLGLTITLGLAELMRGEISLDSTPGLGCTVTVYVPIVAVDDVVESEAPLPVPDASVFAVQGTTVLLCDDDEDMVALLEHYLHRAGYALITTESGAEAVEKAAAYQPDAVIMDINVPGLSGLDAARELRDKDYAGPIIAHTASKLSAEDQATFTRYFRKPAAMNELLMTIKSLTSNHAA
ncbi:MAG: response regulator [Gammaproteobacteria bacterium]|nr:response regulator [Gammaproteobacteria bacterium]NNF48369.1 response regulator [Woeseiaceae bacterium]MBT8093598.1 response regulator [Gammaproteobacteria bacterium]MBT8104295.1 response regulator [Gammaproteobacteria bacterium]NNK24310.1 response regulator [Woeseiaceae bacterium]